MQKLAGSQTTSFKKKKGNWPLGGRLHLNVVLSPDNTTHFCNIIWNRPLFTNTPRNWPLFTNFPRCEPTPSSRTIISATIYLFACTTDGERSWSEAASLKVMRGDETQVERRLMRSVYSTPMMKKNPKAKKHGIQRCIATWTTSTADHFMNEA